MKSSRLISAFAVLALTAMAPVEAKKQPWVEGRSVEFRLPDLDGQLVTSADPQFEGKVVLIDPNSHRLSR